MPRCSCPHCFAPAVWDETDQDAGTATGKTFYTCERHGSADGHRTRLPETVVISTEVAETALFELEVLIERTEDDDPDPLTDATFRAEVALAAALRERPE